MKSTIPWLFVILLAVGWSLDRAQAPEAHAAHAVADEEVLHYDLHALMDELDASGHRWLEFLRVPTLFAGLYALPADATDRQQPHDEDEVYFVAQGRGQITAGDTTFAVQPGSVIYVKANVEHRFHDISEKLQLLVFFSEAKATDEN